jgi:hypothetical protein
VHNDEDLIRIWPLTGRSPLPPGKSLEDVAREHNSTMEEDRLLKTIGRKSPLFLPGNMK